MAMLIVGLIILTQNIYVTTGWYYRTGMPTGLIFIPLILCLVWAFASKKKTIPMIGVGLSVVAILLYVISNVHIHMYRLSLFSWIIILVLIFGGGGLVLKVLFTDPK